MRDAAMVVRNALICGLVFVRSICWLRSRRVRRLIHGMAMVMLMRMLVRMVHVRISGERTQRQLH